MDQETLKPESVVVEEPSQESKLQVALYAPLEAICMFCVYYSPLGAASATQGLCRRYPPVMQITGGAAQPPTRHDGTCGEFVRDARSVQNADASQKITETEAQKMQETIRKLHEARVIAEGGFVPEVVKPLGAVNEAITAATGATLATKPALTEANRPVPQKQAFPPVMTVERMKSLQQLRGKNS